jgi:hypothetical protein
LPYFVSEQVQRYLSDQQPLPRPLFVAAMLLTCKGFKRWATYSLSVKAQH